MSIDMLLKRALPGAKASINGHIDRGARIAVAIQERFQISEPHQWQVKHLRWVLEPWAESLSPSTRYDYWRTARALASMLVARQWSSPALSGEAFTAQRLVVAINRAVHLRAVANGVPARLIAL
ncbi:MAG: hypothetical protein Q8O52_27200 [Sulfuritalea sp.]|nr:hypothetical protein [Sulfuritalea sp.]